MKKFNFVYLTTNLINGKQYVGDHSSNDLSSYKTKNYLGSGRPYLQQALKEYGRKNFKREILEFFNTKEDAYSAQEKYINLYNTLVPNGYNISPTGGHGNRNCWSEESRIKLSLSKKGKTLSNKGRPLTEEHIANLKGKNVGKKHSIEQNLLHNEKIKGVNHPFFGKPRNEETKKKISKSNLGKKPSIETREKMRLAKLGKPSPNKGKTFSAEHRRKLSESAKNRKNRT